MKISIVSPDISGNCLGRAYLLGEMLGSQYSVEIVGPNFHEQTWFPLSQSSDIPIRSFPYRSIKDLARHRHFIDGDVIYASKPLATSFGFALIKAIGNQIPIVLDIDDWELGFVRGSLKSASPLRKINYLGRSLLNLSYSNSYFGVKAMDGLIARSDQVTVSNLFLQNRYGGTIIPHCRDTSRLDPSQYDARRERRKRGFSDDEFVVIFSGSPRPHKGVDVLINAIGLIPDKKISLLIAGIDPADRYCQKLIESGKTQLGDRFRYLNQQLYQALPATLSAIDCVVIPQPANEATAGQLPAKLIDAMAMAKPIITTNIPTITEALGGFGRIVDDNTPAELARAITTIAGNPAMAQQNGANARQRCIDDFSYDRYRDELCQLFRRYC